MRTQLFRGVLALVVALLVSAPAFAQTVAKGVVVDAMGQPIEGATVTFENLQSAARRAETKTNKKGEFLQVGLPPGQYKVTATKDKLTQTLPGVDVRTANNNRQLNFQLSAASGLSDADKATAVAAQAAVAALQAGDNDGAIAKFNALIVTLPTCGDCYYNLGVAYANKQQYDQSEAAYKKAIEIKADNADAYSGLANIYNAQKKFDLAVEASKKAAEIGGAAGGAAGGNAEALYNQGVTLWNAQKYADAKVQFEAALKANPNLALAHYQLGMANLNLGALPEAVAAFENYLKVDPNGPKAAEVKGFVATLKK